jgi:hypothetical protein
MMVLFILRFRLNDNFTTVSSQNSILDLGSLMKEPQLYEGNKQNNAQ